MIDDLIRVDGYGQCPNESDDDSYHTTESHGFADEYESFICCNCKIIFDIVCEHSDYTYGFYSDGSASFYYATNIETWEEFGGKPYKACEG